MATPGKDVEHCGDTEEQPSDATDPSSKPCQITIEEYTVHDEITSKRKLLSIGIFARVYLLDNAVIRKVPCGETDEEKRPIIREATVYSILGRHPRIAECLSLGITDLIETKYYAKGDLAAFVRDRTDELTFDLQKRWFQQIIEAVATIHEHDIIHSDLALRQFFLDDDLNVRLGDFNSSQYPGHIALGYEKASHCLPRDYEALNSVASDLFALGSTLYELLAGKAPYSELYEEESPDAVHSDKHAAIRARVLRQQQADLKIESLYLNKKFPDVSGFWGSDIILGCWKGTITSAKEALDLCRRLDIDP